MPVSYVRMAWDGLKHCMPSGQAYDHFVDGPRTNNNLEGWHSRVKTLAGKTHLNIFEIVELFKTEQSNMEASILQLASGGTLRSKGVSRKRKEERIRKIQEKFDKGDYTLMEHLGALYRWVRFFKLSNTWTLYSDSFHSRTLIMLLFCTVLIIFIW